MQHYVGLDIGTTSTKAIVFAADGAIRGKGHADYPLLVPRPSWAEQDPEAIFGAVVAALRDAVAEAGLSSRDIAAVGVSAAMHSLIAVDRDGQPLTNSIIWADGRSVEQAERLKRDGTGHPIYLRTGTPIHPMSPLTKLMWMREEDPDTFHRAARFFSIKEYVLNRLFGCAVADHSIASATGLFDVRRLEWDEEALRLAGIRLDQLSPAVPTTHVLRGLDRAVAERIGIDPDTPFVVGASDGVLANVGVGAIRPGQAAVTIGTSAALRTVADRPLTDPRGRTFCYVLTGDRWVIGGATNSGGMMLRWFRDEFGAPETDEAHRHGVDPYDLMIEAAGRVPAGADGLLFLPFLAGERAPYWNANARGAFFGIALHHKREHFIRAVLEGILFGVYAVGQALSELAGPLQEIRASGGFARSRMWRQMLSNLFGCELLTPESPESSCFGAAALAMYALGAIRDLGDVERLIRVTERQTPDRSETETYRQLFSVYERVYRNTAGELAELAEYQRRSLRSLPT